MNIIILLPFYHDFKIAKRGLDEFENCKEHNFTIKPAQGANIESLRNALVTNSDKIKQQPLIEYDYALTIDSDIVPELSKVIKMISRDKDIVCLPYLEHKSDTVYVCGDLDRDNIISHRYTTSEKGFKKIGWSGGGMMLIKTSKFASMDYPYYDNKYIRKGNHANKTSEMVGFCINARCVWCDFDNPVHHEKRNSDSFNWEINSKKEEDNMEDYTFKLSHQEADVVIRSLGELPFKISHGVISKMQNQFSGQVKDENGTSDKK